MEEENISKTYQTASIIKYVLTFVTGYCCPLLNSFLPSLWWVHCFCQWMMEAQVEMTFQNHIQYSKQTCLNSRDILETTPSLLLFHGKQEFKKDQIWSVWTVGATLMFSVIETFVITEYWTLMHCHAKSTNFSSTIIPDGFGGLAPLWINCLALRNKFMAYNAVTVKKKNYLHCLDVSDLPHFLQMWRGDGSSNWQDYCLFAGLLG